MHQQMLGHTTNMDTHNQLLVPITEWFQGIPKLPSIVIIFFHQETQEVILHTGESLHQFISVIKNQIIFRW